MHKILLPRYATYKEGPQTEETSAPRKMHLRIRLRAHMSACQGKVEPGKLHLGVGRPPGLAEPEQTLVQVHLGEE